MAPPDSPDALFSGLFARGAVAEQVSDRALLRAMVDVELALLSALGRAGLAPLEAEHELRATVDADELDIGVLGLGTAEQGTPVPALIAALHERARESAAGRFLHRGATSQDVLDTSMMLVARRALDLILADIAPAARRCAELAEEHRRTLQVARTLLQQAVPSTFGLTAACWLEALDGASSGLARVRDRELAVQLGGAAGTLAGFGDRGLEVLAHFADALGLAEPELPWHTIRLRTAHVACELGTALGAMGKIARDLVLLAQTEVGELREGGATGRGGSSTMPHKRNPVGAVAVLACAYRAPGLVATILGAMAQEHQRGAGGWQAEWTPWLELLRLAGSAAASLRETLAGLVIDAERMRANLELTHGLVMSESVALALADTLGRARAQEVVAAAGERAAREGRELAEVLQELPEVSEIDPARIANALSPEAYLGAADALIDRALAAHRELGGARP